MSNENQNLTLWEQVSETPPGFTKTNDFEGRLQTSINPIYLARRATELFGPIGIGWGYDIVEERFDNGRTIHNEQGEILGVEMVNTIRLKFWYMQGDKKGEFEQYGHTPFVYWSHNWKSFRSDSEASKKSLTDAMKKCLSLLGFSADIYLGLFEQPEYLEAAKLKEQIEKADDRDERLAEERTKFAEWASGELELYKESKSPAAMKTMHGMHRRKVERQTKALGLNFEKAWKRFADAYKEASSKDLPNVVCEQCGEESKDKPGNICRSCGGKKIAIK